RTPVVGKLVGTLVELTVRQSMFGVVDCLFIGHGVDDDFEKIGDLKFHENPPSGSLTSSRVCRRRQSTWKRIATRLRRRVPAQFLRPLLDVPPPVRGPA